MVDEGELVWGKSWCGLRLEGTEGTEVQRHGAITWVCGASQVTTNEAEEIMEAPQN